MKQFSEIKRLQDAETGLTLKKKNTNGTGSSCTPFLLKCHTHTHTHMCLGIWRVEGRENPIIHKNENLIQLQTLGRGPKTDDRIYSTHIFCLTY